MRIPFLSRAPSATPAPRVEPTFTAPAAATDGTVDRSYSLAWPTPMLWGMFGGGGSNTGVPVTPLSALQSAAVYACIKCVAEDIGKLTLRMERRVNGGWRTDTDHPMNRLIARPNQWQTPMQFWSYMTTAVMLRGNSMAAVMRGVDGVPLRMIPVNWDRISVLLSPQGELYYNISHPQVGAGVTFHQSDVVHTRNPVSVDGGYLGTSAIAVAQDVIGLALAAQTHGATLFRQGAQIAGFLKTAGMLSPEAAINVQRSWSAAYSGVQNAHKVAVLEQGMDFTKIGMTNEDAQFLETRKYSRTEICSLFRVPPHKIQDLEHAHFSNLEQSNRSYVEDALQPIATEIEQRLGMVLLFMDEQDEYRFRFDFSDLLRGDFAARMTAYKMGIDSGVLNPNEARGKEGLNPYEGGDKFRWPLNTVPMGGNVVGVPAPSPNPTADGEKPDGDGDKLIPLDSEIADSPLP